MRKIMLLGIMSILMLITTGCGSPYVMNKVNGRYYETSNRDCPLQKMKSDGLTVECYTKEGKYIKNLYPVHNNVIRERRYQQQQFNQSMNSLNQTIAYQNRTNAISMSNMYSPYGYYRY